MFTLIYVFSKYIHVRSGSKISLEYLLKRVFKAYFIDNEK